MREVDTNMIIEEERFRNYRAAKKIDLNNINSFDGKDTIGELDNDKLRHGSCMG